MMWDGGYSTGGWIFGSIIVAIVLVLIVVGTVLLVRGFSGRPDFGRFGGAGHDSSSRPAGPGTALNILEERYARGEIDREEFLGRKKDLEGK